MSLRKLPGLTTAALAVAVLAGWTLMPVQAPAQPPAADPIDIFGGGEAGGAPGADGSQQHVTVSARFTAPQGDEPGRLFITARIQENWHIYSITQAPGGPVRTQITLEPSPDYSVTSPFTASPPPKPEKYPEAFGDLVVESHYGEVTWYAPIELAPGVEPASLAIRGKVKAQPCDPDTCLPPRDYPFEARLGPGVEVAEVEPGTTAVPGLAPPSGPPAGAPPGAGPPGSSQAEAELRWRPFTTVEAAERLVGDQFTAEENEVQASVWEIASFMVIGFLGGLILNIMPCVLPVIGLKLMSFIEQAGEDRAKAFSLNVWYSIGIVAVFLLLAGLAVVAGMGWGQLFSRPEFNIALAAVVFVMALSFLGVWEVPIPGFAGRGAAGELAQKEGVAGAFAKGVLTTILATPCSAPFLGSAMIWALAQPAPLTMAAFFSAGLGMASPYLLIGAFPGLIRFLPKPGAWMETFKQIMGFVLLGTVVFIFTFLDWSYLVPTLGLLMGLWLACWRVGRISPTADGGAKARGWLEAAAIGGLVWLLMFPGLKDVLPKPLNVPGLHDMTRGRYQEAQERAVARYLEDLRQQGVTALPQLDLGNRTVLIDFTADWCLTCKTLEATVLNTQAVREATAQLGVVPLKADWTHADPEVTDMLERLGSKQVPTLVIIPAGNWEARIRQAGGYTQGWLLEALERAVDAEKPLAEEADAVAAAGPDAPAGLSQR
jgi:suppressor for copper-sensitivity B